MRIREQKSQLDNELKNAKSGYSDYVNTAALFDCQKPAEALINADELAFQTVHQVEELWMKLLGHGLIDCEAAVAVGDTATALCHFQRVHQLLRLMSNQLGVLSSMTPGAYAEIRTGLGQGSGQDSPGYRAMVKHAKRLWPAYKAGYLDPTARTIEEVYRAPDASALAIAEALIEIDLGLARFRQSHLDLVDRMIGLSSLSLKGLPAAELVGRVNQRCFQAVWAARERATDASSDENSIKIYDHDEHEYRNTG